MAAPKKKATVAKTSKAENTEANEPIEEGTQEDGSSTTVIPHSTGNDLVTEKGADGSVKQYLKED